METVLGNRNIVESKTCLCGCGELVSPTNSFVKGHNRRGIGIFETGIYSPRACLCGCGAITRKLGGRFNRYIKGHENVGRAPWNKGKSFSVESRKKMSLARFGKEPANKTFIDRGKLYRLYVKERKNISTVSKELDVSKDAVKNRLHSFGWSRSTKESCNTPDFKLRMRLLRIKVLTSEKTIEAPNKLEKLVYETLDQYGVIYEKQVPMFGKFVVDALFPQQRLVLEIFGRYWHTLPANRKRDRSKKKYLEKCGYLVEELWDDEIKRVGINLILEQVFGKYGLR